MKIPHFDIKRQYQQIKAEALAVFEEILDSQILIGGPHVERLEASLKSITGSADCVTVITGTDALVLALKALGIGPGDQVVTPAFSFFASTGTIAWLNAEPVFADIDSKSFNVTARTIEAALTPKTKAIVVVHLYGQMADMDPIMKLAKEKDLPVVEDFAQSLGSKYKGKSAGSIGDIGATSFYPTKNLGTCGEGGMITVARKELGEALRMMRNHGMRVRYHHEAFGTNSRLGALHAAYIGIKLKYLEQWEGRRNEIATYYTQSLSGLPIEVPIVQADCKHVWNQYTVQVSDRDRVLSRLTDLGVGTQIYYPFTIPSAPMFKNPKGQWAVAERVASRCLSIPIFPELTDSEVEYVAEAMKKAVG